MPTNTAPRLTATDTYAIDSAGPDGCASWALNVTPATRKKSAERMVNAGLAVTNHHGTWLTPAGWAMRANLRTAAGRPADDVVTWVLIQRTRAKGAMPVTYAPGVNRRHNETV